MTDIAVARPFLEKEIDSLEPLDFLSIIPTGDRLHAIEVARTEDGALEVGIPGRASELPELEVASRKALLERGFKSSDAADAAQPWTCTAPDSSAVVGLVQQVLAEVFKEKPDVPLDIVHGSHRLEYETERKLAATRKRIEEALRSMSQDRPEQDEDGDYLLAVDGVHVIVSPRALADGLVAVRVFAITNLGVQITPDLGLFIARINFGLVFGRLTLDVQHGTIWVDETLLGDQFSDEELRFAIGVVASLAREWTGHLKERFGGVTYKEELDMEAKQAKLSTKPGHGLYL